MNKNNFSLNTIANFKFCNTPMTREPDYTSWSYKTYFIDYNRLEEFSKKDNSSVKKDELFEGMTILYDRIDPYFNPSNLAYQTKINVTVKSIKTEGFLIKVKNKESSKYWFTDEGVYRFSDHWGEVKNCTWLLNFQFIKIDHGVLAFCPWNDFRTKWDEKTFNPKSIHWQPLKQMAIQLDSEYLEGDEKCVQINFDDFFIQAYGSKHTDHHYYNIHSITYQNSITKRLNLKNDIELTFDTYINEFINSL